MTSAEDTTFGPFRNTQQDVSSGDEDVTVTRLEEMRLLDGVEGPEAGLATAEDGTGLAKVMSR